LDVLVLSPIFKRIKNEKAFNLTVFLEWAKKRGILLEGINIDSNQSYYEGYDPEKNKIDIGEVPGLEIAAETLYKVEDSVLETMEGKTFYFSAKPGRSYTVFNSFPESNILVGLNRGIIIEQSISEHTVIHELGHIIDGHGIRDLYDDQKDIFKELLEERDRIFAVDIEYDPNRTDAPEGFISVYATANDQENFAEHFAYYILYPEEFREKAKTNSKLKEKYDFFKRLFGGKEY